MPAAKQLGTLVHAANLRCSRRRCEKVSTIIMELPFHEADGASAMNDATGT
jgi:hypothetical protein